MKFRRKGGIPRARPAASAAAPCPKVIMTREINSDESHTPGGRADVKVISWVQRLTPAMPDLVFGLVLATVLIGGRTGLLNDPGTFWHVRLGREIVSTGHVPRADALTYTREGVPWVDQSWAFDAALAVLVDHAGWSAAIAAAALGLAALYAS